MSLYRWLRARLWRWYVIEGHGPVWTGSDMIDPAEYVVAVYTTRRAAERCRRRMRASTASHPALFCRVTTRRRWEAQA